ncbi:histone-fold-containing protein [Gonapodya prolifera JEL478]|uniref:Histone-fold-containing protein n=1 Tax=Gonapodya prolifera (strain JEL478) TaxID=1344416 RepID=A0A139AZG4_GONPJ|nr:histone-fold-containing protein [Gonapodya prolifera JEL478]|eukprot:KXS22104.1 histone-fold-containing protein [Gonapodya prolifera JEL478]
MPKAAKKTTFKTRFPAARIKKIMRVDDEVGKVAATTPILISKAVELFLQSLIDEACKEARDSRSKKVTISHIKDVVQGKDSFDFLRDKINSLPQTDVHEGDVSPVKNKKKEREQ